MATSSEINRQQNTKPLAEKVRPTSFDEMVGQTQLIGPNGILTNMLKKHINQSYIFYGPPGCGKTTTGYIIAKQANMQFYEFNATKHSTNEIKAVISKNKDQQILIYIDEIQYFNKKQQQILLSFIESGEIILIASTTENPYHALYDALLSRCVICEFKPIDVNSIFEKLTELNQAENALEKDALQYIAQTSAGDMRRAITTYDIMRNQYNGTNKITSDDVKSMLPSAQMSRFDLDSDIHYACISGLQKSIRGSDPDAAIFYLAKLLEGGDIISPCRRLLVIANEDIGLAYPEALSIVYALTETAKQLGLPEANKPLTNAVLLLALSPKCSTAEKTYNPAAEDVHNGFGTVIPNHLRHACSKGYIWPHAYPNHWYPQQYLPNDLIGRKYYVPENNAFEQNCKAYWDNVKGNTK